MTLNHLHKVDVVPSGCWEWTGGIHQGGYGGLFADGKSWKAHRYFYTQLVGPIPDGILVCHHCDNRRCVNPAHLFLGTQKDNLADRDRKGRQNYAKGERHGHAIFTDDEVRQVKRLLADGKTQTEIAKIYGVDHRRIWDISSGRLWRHVKP